MDRGPNTLNSWFVPEEGEPAVPGQGPAVVTVADVARFLPALADLHAEPDGWAVVGVPANFWVDVTPMTVGGELLGGPAQVRFTPRMFRWSYGDDGGGRTTSTPGATWAALGQEELTATPTSHVYKERGVLQSHVDVVFSADYRIADRAWTPVVGAVTGSTPPQRVLVVRERTVLTAGSLR